MGHQLRKLAIAVSLSWLSLICFPAIAADWHPYDWLLTVETEEIPNQFKYAGSRLTPLVEAHISFAKADNSYQGNYETIYYCKGRAFGLNRFGLLDVGPGQSVAVRVVHKTKNPTTYDYKAAANAVIRMLLDVRTSHNALQSVTIPDDSYSSVTAEMAGERFEPFFAPLETPYQIAGALFVQDESHKHSQLMCYAPNSPGY
ncbi:MAG: hypothetical protein C5B53_11235 [Candidatus Melainabacteria bacterium]|nr:MAG: hypothetical protein C5B53_11235 [Candidatus Melainabacteria bacterium]